MCLNFFKRNKTILLTLPENVASDVCYLYTKKPIPFDSRLIVPEGYSALLCYHNRIHYELNSGNFVLNSVTIPEIIKQQSKNVWNSTKQKAIKNFYLQVYFIKQGEHKTRVSCKHKKYKFSDKQKGFVNIEISIRYTFIEPKIFISNMIDNFGAFKSEKFQSNFEALIYDELNLYVLKNEIEKIGMQFSTEYIANMFNKFKKKYLKIGFDLLEIKIKNLYYENEGNVPRGNFFEVESSGNNNNSPQLVQYGADEQSKIMIENKSEILQVTSKSLTNAKHCPNCQSILIDGAVFCHVCGCRID